MKLTEEYGKKGFNIVALTGEELNKDLDSARSMNLRWLAHEKPEVNYAIAIGGAGEYAVTGVPYVVLIGPDGTVEYEGGPGSLSDKVIAGALKKVKPPTPEQLEAKAQKRAEMAEKFAADKLFARAEHELTQVARLYATTEAGKKAAERAKEIADGEETKAEVAAQKDVYKALGGMEHPGEKLKSKECESLAKKLEKKATDLDATAPRAAKLARDWAAILRNPWK